jgi:hypothetical protein
MSGVAVLYEIPDSPQQFALWSSVHATHHRDINRLIYQNYKLALPEYMLDPFDPNDVSALNNWLYLHQAMHSNQDQILGIVGYDLTDVDWKDRKLLEFWTQQHATEHFQAANILEIG